jgi:hypothetical protein
VRARLLALVTVLLLAGAAAPAVGAVKPLPIDTDVDYQLGGATSVPANVGIVIRDRKAPPLAGRYNVCYVNAFQTQPDERRFWRARWGLVLKRDGRAVVDSTWGEWLLDTRTQAKRAAIGRIVGRWIDGCRAAGYDAVELDNLDSWSRSHGLLRPRHNKALARILVARAHRDGLAVAQKNWAEWDGRGVGFDFAIAEECQVYTGEFGRECDDFVHYYGDLVYEIEYTDNQRNGDGGLGWFNAACTARGSRISVILRDRLVTPFGDAAYRYSYC